MLRGPVDRDGFRHLPGPQSWGVGTPGSGPPDHWRGDAQKSPGGPAEGASWGCSASLPPRWRTQHGRMDSTESAEPVGSLGDPELITSPLGVLAFSSVKWE